MTKNHYQKLKSKIILEGYKNEYDSIVKILEFKFIEKNRFFYEYIWVVINAGMRNQVALIIYRKIINAISLNIPLISVFGHLQKVNSIEYVKKNLDSIFINYIKSENQIDYLENLPFIGKITKYHLARNLGHDFCKPDRHLVRISSYYKTTPEKLCGKISKLTGDKKGVVDFVLWRAGNLGLI